MTRKKVPDVAITYLPVCRLSDLTQGELKARTVEGREILVTVVRGVVYCVANRCSHMAKPLTGGRMIGYQLVCPFHSAQFDIRTGASGGFPATRPIITYRVRVEEDQVLVGIDLTAL